VKLWTVPESWVWSVFHDVATVDSNLVDPSGYASSPHIAPNHIESGTGRLLPYATVAEDGVTSAKHLFRSGHIIYSKIRPYLAKAVLVDFDGLCSADCYPVGTPMVASFLHRWMITSTFTEATSKSQGRTVLPKINQKALATMDVPVAPLNEQRRIVAKIDALQARSRRAREALDAIPALIDRFRQSVLAAAFRGDLTADWRAKHPDVEPASVLLDRILAERKVRWVEAAVEKVRAKAEAKARKAGRPWGPTDDKKVAIAAKGKAEEKYKEPEPVDAESEGLSELPNGWCWARLETLTPADALIVYGIIQPGPHIEDGVPFIRPVDITNGTVNKDALPRTSPEIAAAYERAALEAGDLVYSIVGTIGKWLIVPPSLVGANITQSSVRLRPVYPLDAEYLLQALGSFAVQKQMAKYLFGNAIQRLNVGHVRSLAVPLPPSDEREEMISRAKAGLTMIDTLGGRLDSARRQATTLNQAILAKAFRGELVPQDPNDEPASVLIERIKAEREAAAPAKRKRRSRPRKRS